MTRVHRLFGSSFGVFAIAVLAACGSSAESVDPNSDATGQGTDVGDPPAPTEGDDSKPEDRIVAQVGDDNCDPGDDNKDGDNNTAPNPGARDPSEIKNEGGTWRVNKNASTCTAAQTVDGNCIQAWYATGGDPHKYANWAAVCVGGKTKIIVAKEVDQAGNKCTSAVLATCKAQVQGHPTLVATQRSDARRVVTARAGGVATVAKNTAMGAGEIILGGPGGARCWNANSGRYGAGVAAHEAQIKEAFRLFGNIPKC